MIVVTGSPPACLDKVGFMILEALDKERPLNRLM